MRNPNVTVRPPINIRTTPDRFYVILVLCGLTWSGPMVELPDIVKFPFTQFMQDQRDALIHAAGCSTCAGIDLAANGGLLRDLEIDRPAEVPDPAFCMSCQGKGTNPNFYGRPCAACAGTGEPAQPPPLVSCALCGQPLKDANCPDECHCQVRGATS